MVVTGALGECLVQRFGKLRVVAVILRTIAVLNEAHELQLAAVQLRKRLGMHRECLVGQFRQGHPGNATGGAAERRIDHVSSQPDRLEDLRAVVAGKQ